MLTEAGIADAVPHAVTMTAELHNLSDETGRCAIRAGLHRGRVSRCQRVCVHRGWAFSHPGRCSRTPAVSRGGQLGGDRTCRGRAPSRCAARGHRDDDKPTLSQSSVEKSSPSVTRIESGWMPAELLYTGAVRMPAEAIASYFPLGNGLAGVSAEGFGARRRCSRVARPIFVPPTTRVRLLMGAPPLRDFVGERLARVVCADREMLDDTAITRVAEALARAQTRSIRSAMQRVLEPHPSIQVAVVTGLGASLGVAAAPRARLEVVSLSNQLGGGGCSMCTGSCGCLTAQRQHLGGLVVDQGLPRHGCPRSPG